MGFVYVFDDSPYALANPTLDLQQIQAALKAVPPEISHGATAIDDALCSIRFNPETGDREKGYLVVSDFDDNYGHISRGNVLIQPEMERGRSPLESI